MPRSSIAANPCDAAKSIVVNQSHFGHPKVEKPSGSRTGAPDGLVAAPASGRSIPPATNAAALPTKVRRSIMRMR
jgi:hypothetical protein